MEIPSEINGLKTVSLESITVKNVFRKGVIDITTKAITGLTDVGDVVLTDGEAIIIPQTISRIEFIFKMANGTTEKLAHTKDLTLTSGTKTTLQAISNTDLYFNSFLDLKNGDAQTDMPLSFYVAPGRTWTLTSSAAWLTFSATTGVGAATVKVSVTQNIGTPRTALLTLKDDKGAFAYLSVMQNYSKFDLSADSPNETVPKAGKAYTVNINSNKPWSVTSKTNVSVSPETGLGTTAVTITVPATTIYTTREIKAVFATTGATITRTWSGTQESAAPPTVNINGTRWLTANLGAANPQDYGNFYKWGSTYAYPRESNALPNGHWGGATTGSGSYPNGDPCRSLGAYKTPTHEQWQALVNSGKSSWTTYQGINGYFFGPKASSLTIQDGSIFLPAAGLRHYDDGSLHSETTRGDYRSSSVYSANYGWTLDFNSDGLIRPDYYDWHGGGFSVRCVQE